MSDNGRDETDDELLALAGGANDSDDESLDGGDAGDRTQALDGPASPRSPSQEAKPSVEKVEAAPSRPKGVAQKVKKRGRKKVSRKELDDELLDLGDGPDSEPESVRGDIGPVSDDEADAPGSEEDERPLYPIEGKFTSEQDRRDILALPEIEKEQVLAERAEEVLRRKQDLQLKQAIGNARAKATAHKRKAAAAGLDDAGKAPKKKTALDDYKAKREAKANDRTKGVDRESHRRDRRRSSSAGSDRDADGEDDDVEYADLSSSRSEPPADLKDFERVRIGRTNFAKVCFYPNFEETIKDCFTRVSVGINRETGRNEYRMAQVKGFKQGKPYTLEDNKGKTFRTDLYAMVAQGKSEKPFPFHACSDGKFTLEEFQRYHGLMEREHQRVPRKSYLANKLDDIHKFLNIPWNDENISIKFANKQAMEKRTDPANIAKAKREAIEARRTKAEEDGDEEELAKCEAELAALDNAAMNGHTSANNTPQKAPPKAIASPAANAKSQADLVAINARNRNKTSENVKKALIAERQKRDQEREEARRVAKAAREREAALLAVPSGRDDLFGDTPDISREGTPMGGTPKKRSRSGTPVGGLKKENSKGLGGLLGRKKLEEGIEDLGIDVEI